MSDELTAAEVVRRVRARGFDPTLRQFESLRHLGALRSGRQHGLGQAVGSAWLYPPETVDRFVAFLELCRPEDTQAETAVKLWLRGHNFDPAKLRRCLATALKRYFKQQARAARLGPIGFGEKLVDEVVRNPSLAERYGATALERHEYVQQLGEVIGGIYADPTAPVTPDGASAIEKHLQLSPQTEAILRLAFNTSMAEELPSAMPLIAMMESAIETASGEELLAVRALSEAVGEIRSAMELLPSDFPTREILHTLTGYHGTAYGVAMLILSLRRAGDAPLERAIQNMQSVAAGTRHAAGLATNQQ